MNSLHQQIEMLHKSSHTCLNSIEYEVFDCLYEAWIAKTVPLTQERFIQELFANGFTNAYNYVNQGKKETKKRRLREIINLLRVQHGLPIISSRKGYTLPSTQEQYDHFVSVFEKEAQSKIASILDTLKSVRSFSTKSPITLKI